jgi:hypothetical protein
MKKLMLVLAVSVLSAVVSGAFAGRTGDELNLQDQQNKRVIAERQKHADMQAMIDKCMKMMKQ